jgi:uncharacterized protein
MSDVDIHWDIRIPLRDGACLGGTLYSPRAQGNASPAIVTLTPYIRDTYHEYGLYFAQHGYPFLSVDVRGRGDSDGKFWPFTRDGRDGFDVVEWLAQHSCCDGQVAMWGGSYAGYVQWMTAAQCPPHLKTICPVAAPYIGHDFPMRNNISAPYVMQWLSVTAGRTSNQNIFGEQTFWASQFQRWFKSGQPFARLDSFLGTPSAVFQEWVSHPHQGAYWDALNPKREQYAKVVIPVLTITGTYDGDQPGALRHYREHISCAPEKDSAGHYLVIGPWDHSGTRKPKRQFAGVDFGPESVVDLGRLHLEWYSHVMKRQPVPQFLKSKIVYYLAGAEEWRYEDSIDAVCTSHKRLFLSSTGCASSGVFSSGILNETAAGGTPDVYIYDPANTRVRDSELSAGSPLALTFPIEDLTDQTEMLSSDRQHLVFHSDPFSEDTEVSGFFRLLAWISIDQPDTDFRVCVYEIDTRGRSVLLATDSMRARFRKNLRTEELVASGDAFKYEFTNFTFVARLVKKGSRLRLAIGPINSIYSEKNYNRGGEVARECAADARPVCVRLYHEPTYPSALYVPIREGGMTATSGEPRSDLGTEAD